MPSVHISEFPINLDTARYAIEIERSVATCLCSATANLLAGGVCTKQRGVLSLPEAVKLTARL